MKTSVDSFDILFVIEYLAGICPSCITCAAATVVISIFLSVKSNQRIKGIVQEKYYHSSKHTPCSILYFEASTLQTTKKPKRRKEKGYLNIQVVNHKLFAPSVRAEISNPGPATRAARARGGAAQAFKLSSPGHSVTLKVAGRDNHWQSSTGPAAAATAWCHDVIIIESDPSHGCHRGPSAVP